MTVAAVLGLAIAVAAFHEAYASYLESEFIPFQSTVYNLRGAAINEATGKIYIVDSEFPSGFVLVLNATTLEQTAVIPTEIPYPSDIAVDEASNVAYLSYECHCPEAAKISIINGTSDQVVGSIDVKNYPAIKVTINPYTDKIYAITNTTFLSTFDILRENVSHTRIDEKTIEDVSNSGIGTYDLALSPINSGVYVLDGDSKSILAIRDNGTQNTILYNTTIDTVLDEHAIDNRLVSMAVNPITNIIYVVNHAIYPPPAPNEGVSIPVGYLSAVNGSTGEIISNNITQISSFFFDLAVDPKYNIIYALDGSRFLAINGSDNRVIRNNDYAVPESFSPRTILVSPVENMLYLVGPTGIVKIDSLVSVSGELAKEPVSLPYSPDPYKHFDCFDECRYNLSYENQTYSLSYRLWREPYGDPEGIRLESIHIDRSAKTVTLDMTSPDQGGTIVFSLSPRLSGTLDFKTISFFVDDRKLVPGKEVWLDRYTYLFDFPSGTDNIRFVGQKEAGINDEINRSFTLNATSIVTDENGNSREVITPYDIVYNITNGRIDDVQIMEYEPIPNAVDGVLVVEFTPVGDGILSLQFPRELLDKLAPINGVQVSDDYEGIKYVGEMVTCDYRTVMVAFDEWTESPIEIYGMYLGGIVEKGFVKEEAILPLIQSRDVGFPWAYANNNADICGWQLSTKDKSLDIFVKENSTLLNVTIPDRIFGGPYTIFAVDGMDKTKVENFTQSTKNITHFRNGEDKVVDYNDLTIEYPNGTEAIRIIGTTAMPEFGSSIIALFVMAAAITSVLVAAKRFRSRQ